jgi:hypothetical protein
MEEVIHGRFERVLAQVFVIVRDEVGEEELWGGWRGVSESQMNWKIEKF